MKFEVGRLTYLILPSNPPSFYAQEDLGSVIGVGIEESAEEFSVEKQKTVVKHLYWDRRTLATYKFANGLNRDGSVCVHSGKKPDASSLTRGCRKSCQSSKTSRPHLQPPSYSRKPLHQACGAKESK